MLHSLLWFFRLGEITAQTTTDRTSGHCVSVGDVAVDNLINPTIVKIHLSHSKTDQFHQGVDIYLGKTGQELCPVSALLAYLAVRMMRLYFISTLQCSKSTQSSRNQTLIR